MALGRLVKMAAAAGPLASGGVAGVGVVGREGVACVGIDGVNGGSGWASGDAAGGVTSIGVAAEKGWPASA